MEGKFTYVTATSELVGATMKSGGCINLDRPDNAPSGVTAGNANNANTPNTPSLTPHAYEMSPASAHHSEGHGGGSASQTDTTLFHNRAEDGGIDTSQDPSGDIVEDEIEDYKEYEELEY